MAIRIRLNKKNHYVALCAAETKPKSGDLYIDDAMHEALADKFEKDWASMGFLKDKYAKKWGYANKNG